MKKYNRIRFMLRLGSGSDVMAGVRVRGWKMDQVNERRVCGWVGGCVGVCVWGGGVVGCIKNVPNSKPPTKRNPAKCISA